MRGPCLFSFGLLAASLPTHFTPVRLLLGLPAMSYGTPATAASPPLLPCIYPSTLAPSTPNGLIAVRRLFLPLIKLVDPPCAAAETPVLPLPSPIGPPPHPASCSLLPSPHPAVLPITPFSAFAPPTVPATQLFASCHVRFPLQTLFAPARDNLASGAATPCLPLVSAPAARPATLPNLSVPPVVFSSPRPLPAPLSSPIPTPSLPPPPRCLSLVPLPFLLLLLPFWLPQQLIVAPSPSAPQQRCCRQSAFAYPCHLILLSTPSIWLSCILFDVPGFPLHTPLPISFPCALCPGSAPRSAFLRPP